MMNAITIGPIITSARAASPSRLGNVSFAKS
jgi:hypothetical protein